MDIFSVFTLCGGLAFFLYGMTVMSKSLEKMAGGKLERTLKRMTSSRLSSLLLGAGITIAIQSSSAVTVMLVGLVAKNAILIVEFAKEEVEKGRDVVSAALTAAHLRFRPIVMTSLAFILGCVPLAISSGAGANSRHAIGTAVVGGMLAATCIATLFVPYFFRSIMRISLKLQGKKDPNEGKKSFDEEEDI